MMKRRQCSIQILSGKSFDIQYLGYSVSFFVSLVAWTFCVSEIRRMGATSYLWFYEAEAWCLITDATTAIETS